MEFEDLSMEVEDSNLDFGGATNIEWASSKSKALEEGIMSLYGTNINAKCARTDKKMRTTTWK